MDKARFGRILINDCGMYQWESLTFRIRSTAS